MTVTAYNRNAANQTPAFFVDIPAAPGAVSASVVASVTASFATPFTEAVSSTGPAPSACSESVEKADRSAMPLAVSPSTMIVVPRMRRMRRLPFASRTTSYWFPLPLRR